MIEKVLFFFFFIVSIVTIEAQDFFLIDTIVYPSFTDNRRRVIDLSTCAVSTSTSEIPDIGYPLNPPDITIAGGTPNSFLLSRGNWDDQPDDVIGHSPGVLNGPSLISGIPYAPETLPMGIAADYNRNVFMVGERGLSFIDGANLDADYISDLPPSFQPLGQMTFREGSFYYPSINHELIQLKIDADHNFYLRSVGSLPDTLLYGGLFSIPVTCDSSTTYLIHRAPDIGSTIYVLDVANATISEHCGMPYKAISAAYNGENTLPPCDDYLLDLDINNAATLDRQDSLCSGTIALLDDQMSLSPDLEFDSITITIQNTLNGTSEWVDVTSSHPEVIISGNSTQRLTLASTGFTKAAPLLEVLASLRYTNDALTPTEGQRTLEVTVHHPFQGAVSAFIYVEVVAGTLTITQTVTEPTCFGYSNGMIELDVAGTASYNLNWEDGSMNLVQNDLTSGTYIYQILDDTGCSYGDTLLLNQPDTLILSIEANQDSICGNNGVLTGIPIGGTPDYSYDWSTAGDVEQIDMLSPGTYSLTVSDTNDCEAIAEYTLFLADTQSGELQSTACFGQSISVNGQNYSQDTTFQQMLTTTDGCDSLLDVQLTFFDTFYSFSAFELCPGDNINLYDQFITQDTNFLVTLSTEQGCDSLEYYEVSFSAPLTTPLTVEICQGNTYSFAGLTLTTSGVYYDTLMASSGCDSLLELTLTVNALPVVVIEQNGSLCNGDVVDLSLDNGFAAIVWNDGSTASQLEVSAAGSYGVTAMDNNGCSNTASVTLTDDPPAINFAVQNPACPEGNGALEILSIEGGLPPYQIESSGQVISPGDVISGLAVGSYDYMIQDAAACSTSINFQITPENTLTVDLPEELSIKLGESIEIPVQTTTLPSQISWSPPEGLDCTDCLMPVASPTQSTRYFLNLEDENGCRWEGSTFIKVAIPGLYIPNAFSPNGDGSNDTFAPVPNDAVSSIKSFSIFDRWGAQVFQMASSMPSWNGLINGQLAAEGVYVYFIEWVDKAGNVRRESGEVVLLR